MPDAGGVTAAIRVDAAIVGASLAGCATAIVLGRAGLRVALIDKHADQTAYKRLCGHFLQASATPTLDRLGLVDPIEAAGGVRNGIEALTRWGTIAGSDDRRHGYSLRRMKLDPLIRAVALETPGVEYMPARRLVGLLGASEEGPAGVELSDSDGGRHLVKARVVIGADGRNSTVARLAAARERRSPNNRFCAATYFTGVGLPEGCAGRLWMSGHELALAAPNEDGITVMGVFLDNRRLGEFRGAGREAKLLQIFAALPDPPRMADARREDRIQGYSDYELIERDPTPQPNVALVGDAGLTSDPAMAIGCGWALQSAVWLADALAPALAAGAPVAPALGRYKRDRRRNLLGHHRVIALDARVRWTTPGQRMMLRAAVTDPEVRERVLAYGERSAPVRRLFSPGMLARTVRAPLTRAAPAAG